MQRERSELGTGAVGRGITDTGMGFGGGWKGHGANSLAGEVVLVGNLEMCVGEERSGRDVCVAVLFVGIMVSKSHKGSVGLLYQVISRFNPD